MGGLSPLIWMTGGSLAAGGLDEAAGGVDELTDLEESEDEFA